ncbi:MAG: hypothetical protein E4H01_16550 [Lysobacterales bacterium]|nr:MAG: hypothetical protein E4H01_16550 [Xanthomonadales bacterium]
MTIKLTYAYPKLKGANLIRKTFSFLSIGVWLLCIVSLLGIHAYYKRKPTPKNFILAGRAIFEALDDEEKTNVARFDTAIIRLTAERFKLIGLGHESEEANLVEDNEISFKKIELRINDPVLVERQAMVKEAYQTLNNAERKCLSDHFAAIIYRNGDYFLCLDKKKYSEYVLKYGTECKQCDEMKTSKPK